MPGSTTIKVPRELRDRLAAIARATNTTLAVTLAQMLDEADERAFWVRVAAENAALTPEQRADYAGDASLLDDVDDVEDLGDNNLSETNGW